MVVRAPPVGLGLGEAVDQADQAGRREEGALDVVSGAALHPALMHDPKGGDCGHEGDRNVDQQTPAPRRVLGQEAAEQDADGSSCSRDRPVGAERLCPLLRVGLKGDGQDRERGGSHQGRECTLERPCTEQQPLGGGQAAEGGCRREADEPHHEHPLAPPEVGDPTSQEEQPAKGKGVCGDDPLTVGHRDVQVPLCRREGDRHDRGVQHHHQLGHHDDSQDRPTSGIGSGQRVVRCGGGHGISFGWVSTWSGHCMTGMGRRAPSVPNKSAGPRRPNRRSAGRRMPGSDLIGTAGHRRVDPHGYLCHCVWPPAEPGSRRGSAVAHVPPKPKEHR